MNRHAILEDVEKSYIKAKIPVFKPGDQVRVYVKIVDEAGERVQSFEGTVMRRRGHGVAETFTVRKMSFGVGVERTFPLHSPRIERIEQMRSGSVRRARLYYMRDKVGKESRIEEERVVLGDAAAPQQALLPAKEKPKTAAKPPADEKQAAPKTTKKN